LIEAKETEQIVLNERGTSDITITMQLQNKSDKPRGLSDYRFMELRSDIVDIQVTDSSGKSLPHKKEVEADHVWACVDLSDITLKSNEEYSFTVKYISPSAAKRFDSTFFVTIYSRHNPGSTVKTVEGAYICDLPRLFSKYKFWKEMYVNAPAASRVYTQNGTKKVEFHSVLPRGSHREFSFMFQERYNSKIVALLSFLLGVGLIQFSEWLIDLLF